MAVDLLDFVPALRREVNPPGTDVFSSASDDDMVGYLMDAFWEARLDGFLVEWTCDEDGVVTPNDDATGDIPRPETTLVIVYAGVKVLRNRILNMNTSFRAKAGPVEYQADNSATMLVEMLKQLKAQKDRILAQAPVSESLDYAFDALVGRSAYYAITADVPHLALPGPETMFAG